MILKVYLAGLVIVWGVAIWQYRAEPTTHGRMILAPLGCITGVLWPILLAWIILISPFVLRMWWRGELE